MQAPARLAFVGTRARVLILASPGRGWLPTGRPAEATSASARVRLGGRESTVSVDGGRLTVGLGG